MDADREMEPRASDSVVLGRQELNYKPVEFLALVL